jgi:hypothetical protein
VFYQVFIVKKFFSMKKAFWGLFFLLAITHLKALDASVTFATFKTPAQPYVEIYFYFVGETIKFNQLDSNNYQANLGITILFKRDTQIVKFDKYLVHSPIFDRNKDFIDLKIFELCDLVCKVDDVLFYQWIV